MTDKTIKDNEYVVVRDIIQNDDGSETYYDKLCDKYGLSIQVTISRHDKNGKAIGNPIILCGM